MRLDDTAIYADWKNNANLRNQLNVDIVDLLYANGYPPEWHDKVYDRVMEQVDNFKRHESESDDGGRGATALPSGASGGRALPRVFSTAEVLAALRFREYLPVYTLRAA